MHRNPNACSVDRVHLVQDVDLENLVYDGIANQRESGYYSLQKHLLQKALSHSSSFKDGDHEKQFHWLYPFIFR